MIWTPLVDGLLPQRCRFCDRPGAGPVCADCRRALPWNTPACPGCALPSPVGARCARCLRKPRAFDAAFAAFRYAAPAAQALLGLKYAARFAEARWLAEAMAAALRERGTPLPELLLPVPLHRGRLFRRGHNQALELARRLGAELGVAVDARAARRLRATPDQIGLRAAQRRRNIKDAFAVDARIAGRHVALLDDVMTTGATLEALARACTAAGAARVEAWAVARTPAAT